MHHVGHVDWDFSEPPAGYALEAVDWARDGHGEGEAHQRVHELGVPVDLGQVAAIDRARVSDDLLPAF